METWDAYNVHCEKVPELTLIRGEEIPDGMYHLVSEIIVKHIDGSFLLMQRDFTKKEGGLWEITAGGSALKGETAEECAQRELREETGITTDKIERISLIVHDIHKTIYEIFFCIVDTPKKSVILQEGETCDYRWMTKDELLNLDEGVITSKRAISLIKNRDL